MAGKLSKPEQLAHELFERLGWPDIVQNEGLSGAKIIPLVDDGLGVSVFRDGILYFDNPKTKRPKCYRKIRPDFLWGKHYIEVKGCIDGDSWDGLSRDSLNDQIRATLLRARLCNISDLELTSFDSLSTREREVATECLSAFANSNPRSRRYLRWENLVSAIASPQENFLIVTIELGGISLPIKQLNTPFEHCALNLFVLDIPTMREWKQLLGWEVA
jgi:hypothetical protein